MMRLIREFRRRHMFRVAGLYIGIWWIVLQVADIIFPAFNVPDWVVRGIVVVAFVGFPVTMALTWLYELTEKGLVRDTDVREEEIAPLFGGRTADFVVIGVLFVALSFSVYLNLRAPTIAAADLPPLTILVSNFDNQTGDPLFDGTIEHAVTIGLEAAPFISAYPRDMALRVAEQIQPDATLTGESARLVAVREGIQSVLSGAIVPDGAGFKLSAQVLEPQQGETFADVEVEAASKLEILEAVGRLAFEIRADLGDEGGADDTGVVETFTAASLEAAHAYTQAQELASAGHDQEALEQYKAAVRFDPEFGRAYSGWALSAFKLGQIDEAEQQWTKTLSLLERMTEREKYRTLGVYYSIVSRNIDKAIENNQALVELYPADSAAHNNLAVAFFMRRDFDRALEQGGRVLEIYPKKLLYRANYALYAMYAGDFATAAAQGEEAIEQDPSYHKAYLPQAMAALVDHDFDGTLAAYEKMSAAGARGASLANTGIADAALFRGDNEAAKTALLSGIEQDLENDNQSGAAAKYIVLAETHSALGETVAAVNALNMALELRRREAQMVPAATLYLSIGRIADAQALADELGTSLQPQSRAYSELLDAQIALASGDIVTAVDLLRSALERADAWLIRLHLGIAYLQADLYAEALSEFELCEKRRGEVTSVFLDDVPSYRYMAQLHYWLARAKEGLGMTADANDGYRAYLALRADSPNDKLATDATARLEAD